jgi:hypothetical protein
MNRNGEIEITEIKEDSSKGETVRTHCNNCGKEMNHEILKNYCEIGTAVLDSEPNIKYGICRYTEDFSNDYQIIKCSGCDTVSYRSIRSSSEYQDFENNGPREERFPPLKKRTGKKFKYLPAALSKIYQEVIASYNNDSFILCASGIRATLEGICKDKGTNVKYLNLNKKINKIVEKGFVSQQYESILHKLRFLGNDAIHELQEPTHEEINVALDIIEHITENLYEIPEKAEILQQRTPDKRETNP